MDPVTVWVVRSGWEETVVRLLAVVIFGLLAYLAVLHRSWPGRRS